MKTANIRYIRIMMAPTWATASVRIVGGSVRLYGIDLATKTDLQLRRYRWREIAIVFQGAMNALNPVQRVGDQIAEPIEVRLGQSRDASLKRARELLDLVGLSHAANLPLKGYSKGMNQRIGLAERIDATREELAKLKDPTIDQAVIVKPAEVPQLFTRTFKVDPNTFYQGLESVEGRP